MVVKKVNYGEMTWPEIREVVKENRVPVIPVATIEDHGHHLPVDTDIVLTMDVCRRVGERIPDKVVLVPPIIHGFTPHHMDFPGPLTIGAHTFIDYVADVCKSLAHHGFRRMLILNGHGSNVPLLDVSARLAMLETEARVALVSHWGTRPIRELVRRIRESELGGISHACELETSMYLAIKPELVDMSKARKDMTWPPSKFFWEDMVDPAPDCLPNFMMEYWSTLSETGTQGDPTTATAEKGEAFLSAATDGVVAIIEELRERPLRKRVDHHKEE